MTQQTIVSIFQFLSLIMLLCLASCQKEAVDEMGVTRYTASSNAKLTIGNLSEDLRLRLLNGPAGGAIASLRQTQLQARTTDTRVDTLVELFVSQFEAESSLESFLQLTGYPAWEATLLPGMGYGENIFVIPVINECELKGNCFVFHNTNGPLSEHRLDYYSYEYTDVGYRVGAQFMSDEELTALYMVAGGQATSQYVLLGTVDTAAVLFRHYVDEAGGLTAALSARTTSCSVLYCDDLETTLPPDFSDNGNPNTGGGGGGGGGGWPHTGSPGDPEWHSGGWIFYGPGSSGGSGGGGFQWPTIKWPNFGGGGSGGSIWNKVRRFFGLCYQFREGPAVGDRYHDLAVEASVSARTGNCEWIQIHGVEDVSMYTYLGNTQLGEEWGIDINEFECRGIAFGNEAMSIDFAFGIRHILATYEEIDWQLVKCLAENPEFAAVANAALEEFAGSSTCSGVSIEDYVEDRMHSFCASGTDSEDAASALHRDLEREEWIDLTEIESECTCMYDIIITQMEGNSGMCNSLGVFDTDNSTGNVRLVVGVPANSAEPRVQPGLFDANPHQAAQTGIDLNGDVFIAFNPSICNGTFQEHFVWEQWNSFTLALLPVHEGHHAQIRSYILSQGITIDAAGAQRYADLAALIFSINGDCGDPGDPEHTYFLRTRLQDFALHLQSLDLPNPRSLNYYMWWAGRDLFRNDPITGNGYNTCAEDYYGIETLDEWRQLGLELIDTNLDGEPDHSLNLLDQCIRD